MKQLYFLLLITFFIHVAQAQSSVLGNYLEGNGNDVNTNGGYVNIPDNASLDITGADDLTIQFWLNPKSLLLANNTRQGLVAKKTSSGDGYGVFWDVTGTGNGRIALLLNENSNTGTSTKTVASNTINDINNFGWVHISVVIDRSGATDSAFIYFNGQRVASDDVNGILDLSNGNDLRILHFTNSSSGTHAAGASIDEVRIFKSALTPLQIRRFYGERIVEGTGGFVRGFYGKVSTIPWTDLVGYWDMEDPTTSTTITDRSSYGNDGALFNGSTACASAPCGAEIIAPGAALYSSKETFETAQSGDWSNANTWVGGNVPDSDRAIVNVQDGHTLTIDGTYTVEAMHVQFGGTFTQAAGSVLQVTKYFDVEGVFESKTAGNILFDDVGDHMISGDGTLNFFNFELYQNSQVQVEVSDFVNIYGVLTIGDGRLRTSDKVVLRVNKANTARPYGMMSKVDAGNPDVRGTIIMEKELSTTVEGWRQMSMPLKGNLSNFLGMPIFDNTAPATQQNVFFWDNAEDAGTPGNNVGWTPAGAQSGHGKPLSIFLGGSNFPFATTLTFEGEYNWEDTTFSLTYFNDPGNSILSGNPGYENGVGWNFIPNRYPSLLDVQAIMADGDNPLTYKNIHIWNSLTQQYMAFTQSSGDSITPYNNAGTGTAELSGAAIEPMQGFWVKTSDVSENGAVFPMKDIFRSVLFSLNPVQSLKTSSRLQINVFAANDSAWDGAALFFDGAATAGFNPEKDVYKKVSTANVPSLFWEADKRFLQKNWVHPSDERFVLGMQPQPQNMAGKYYLHLEDQAPAGKVVLVEDFATGTVHNLSAAPYAFVPKQTNTSRFQINIVDEKLAKAEALENHGLMAFVANGNLQLHSAYISGEATVELYNANGQLLQMAHIDLQAENTLSLPNNSGLMLVKISHKRGVDVLRLVSF